MGADVVGVGLLLAAMDRQARVRPAAPPGQRHLDAPDVDGTQTPHRRRRSVAEE